MQMHTGSGYVAMLDVLGFSQQVLSYSDTQKLATYGNTVIDTTRPFETILKPILFSDTIVLFTFDDSPEAFSAIVGACSQVMFHLLRNEIPLRGAISHGTFGRAEDTRGGPAIIAGRPIIDAFNWEKKQEWVGIMVSPSVLLHKPPQLTSIPENFRKKPEEIDADYSDRLAGTLPLRQSRVPMHGPASETYGAYAVLPLSEPRRSPKGIVLDLLEVQRQLLWLQQLAPDPRSQEKYSSSVAWLSTIRTEISTKGSLSL